MAQVAQQYDHRTEPHFAATLAAVQKRGILQPDKDQVRAKVENLLWLHQLTWDDRQGGKGGFRALCAHCKWRSDVKELRWEASAAHVRHQAELLMQVIEDDVIDLAVQISTETIAEDADKLMELARTDV